MFRFQIHTRLSIGINVFSILIKYLIMLSSRRLSLIIAIVQKKIIKYTFDNKVSV